MKDGKRVFVICAEFSKAAELSLATELLPLIAEQLYFDDMRDWLDGLHERVAWLSRSDQLRVHSFLNIEEVFHYPHFDIETPLTDLFRCKSTVAR